MDDYDSYDSDEFVVSCSPPSRKSMPSSIKYGDTSYSPLMAAPAEAKKHVQETKSFSSTTPAQTNLMAGLGIGRGKSSGQKGRGVEPFKPLGRSGRGNFAGRGSDLGIGRGNLPTPGAAGVGRGKASKGRGRGIQEFHKFHEKQPRASNSKDRTMPEKPLERIFDNRTFDSDKPPDKWLSEIEWAMTDKNKSGVAPILRECFSSTDNPYLFVLHLIESCPDYTKPKTTSICFVILKEFTNWIDENKAKYYRLLDDDVRTDAFQIGSRGNMVLFDNIVKAYCLQHKGNEYLLPYIRYMLDWQKYKEAATCAYQLDLQDNFEVEEIIIPLLLQDKVNVLENYVFRKRSQQEALLKLLDMLCEKGFSIGDYVKRFNIPNIKRDKLNHKPLGKLAVRLMKLYKISPEMCPNINNAKAMGGIRYLMYKRYTEKTITYEVWAELVESSIGDNVVLQEQFVDSMVDYLDFTEAAKWARKFNLSEESLPWQVKDAMANLPAFVPTEARSQNAGEEDWESECFSQEVVEASYYHTLEFPREKIQWINDRDGFFRCLEEISRSGVTVGIDSEWRPSFGQMESKVSLIQLATENSIFLLDAVRLYKCLSDDDWREWAEKFFCNAYVIKLGYGIGSDFQMLVKAIPCIREKMIDLVRVVDLHQLSQTILTLHPEFFKKEATPKYVFTEDEDGNIESHQVKSKKTENANGGNQKKLPTDRGTDEESDDDEDVGAASVTVNKSEEKGLSDLVRMSCGRALKKTEQMSNWEKRPLREAQIQYAALDAYVLLEVYAIIKEIAAEKKIDINMEPRISMRWMKEKKSKAARKQEAVAELTAEEIERKKEERRARNKPQRNRPRLNREAITPANFHVVCDNMLQGLGKQLRCCGVDVRILENSDEHDRAAVIANHENRIILTSGNPYQTLKSTVPEGMCMNVSNMSAREQVVEVLDHYNVHVTQKDIFSRCQICNGNQYAYIKNDEMKAAWIRRNNVDSDGNYHCPLNQLRMSGQIDFRTLTVGAGKVPIQLDTILEPVLDKIELFFCCLSCGKVYWEGSHFSRVCEQFSHVLKT